MSYFIIIEIAQTFPVFHQHIQRISRTHRLINDQLSHQKKCWQPVSRCHSGITHKSKHYIRKVSTGTLYMSPICNQLIKPYELSSLCFQLTRDVFHYLKPIQSARFSDWENKGADWLNVFRH